MKDWKKSATETATVAAGADPSPNTSGQTTAAGLATVDANTPKKRIDWLELCLWIGTLSWAGAVLWLFHRLGPEFDDRPWLEIALVGGALLSYFVWTFIWVESNKPPKRTR